MSGGKATNQSPEVLRRSLATNGGAAAVGASDGRTVQQSIEDPKDVIQAAVKNGEKFEFVAAVVRPDAEVVLYVSGASGDFTVGETVTCDTADQMGNFASGEVLSWRADNGELTLGSVSVNVAGRKDEFVSGAGITGGTSTETATIDKRANAYFINDTNHAEVGYSRIDVGETELMAMTIHHASARGKNGSMIAVPDESLARSGVGLGVSSNLSDTRLHFGGPMTLKVSLSTAAGNPAIVDGSAYHRNYDVCAFWQAGRAVSVGDIIVPTAGPVGASNIVFEARNAGTTHASTEPTWPTSAPNTVTDNGITWVARYALGAVVLWDDSASEIVVYHCNADLSGQMQATYEHSAKDELILPAVRRVNSREHRIALFSQLEITASYDGSAWSLSNREIERYGNTDGYAVSFNGAGNYIELSHPPVASIDFAEDVTATIKGPSAPYTVYPQAMNRTSMQLQMRDVTALGSLVTSIPSGFAVMVRRGLYQLPRPLGGHLSLTLSSVRIAPQRIVSPTGNIWLLGVFFK